MSFEERQDFFLRSQSFTPYLATATNAGPSFVVRTKDQHVGRSLFAKQMRGDMGVVTRAVRALQVFNGIEAVDGKTFVDVGANIGTSIIAALVNHRFADGVAIEPEPDNYETLTLNLILNDLEERVTALHMAVSDVSGAADLVVDLTQSGKHWIAGPQTVADDVSVISVPTRTLDDLADLGVIEPERVGMIWMDAQAHEAHILAGGSCLTSRGCPAVFEWDPKALTSADSLERLGGIVGENYSHFVDLRRNPDPSASPYELRRVDELASFTEGFLGGDAERRFTDLLAVRLTDEQAALADVAILADK